MIKNIFVIVLSIAVISLSIFSLIQNSWLESERKERIQFTKDYFATKELLKKCNDPLGISDSIFFVPRISSSGLYSFNNSFSQPLAINIYDENRNIILKLDSLVSGLHEIDLSADSSNIVYSAEVLFNNKVVCRNEIKRKRLGVN